MLYQGIVTDHVWKQRVSLPPTAFPGSSMDSHLLNSPEIKTHMQVYKKEPSGEKYSLRGVSAAWSWCTPVFFSLHPSCCLTACTPASSLSPLLTCSHLPDTLFLASPLQELLPVSRNSRWNSEELFHSLCQYLILFCMKNMHSAAHNAHSHPCCVLTLKDLRAECYAEFGEGEHGS